MTHCFMVIHPCAEYGMQMSKQKIVSGRTRIYIDRQKDGQTVIPTYPMNKAYKVWLTDKKTSQLLILEWV